MECPICLTTVTELFSVACSNKFCCSCIFKYLKHAFDTSRSYQITCLCCDLLIDHEKIQSIPEVQSLRDDYELYFLAQKTKGSFDCVNCRSVVLTTIVINACVCQCVGCKTFYCPKCRDVRPEGRYDYKPCTFSSLDVSVKNWITSTDADVDRCPVCGALATKTGCRFVKCLLCRHNFTWKCPGAATWIGRYWSLTPSTAATDPTVKASTLLVPEEILLDREAIMIGRAPPYRIEDLKEFAKKYGFSLSGARTKSAILDKLTEQIKKKKP